MVKLFMVVMGWPFVWSILEAMNAVPKMSLVMFVLSIAAGFVVFVLAAVVCCLWEDYVIRGGRNHAN